MMVPEVGVVPSQNASTRGHDANPCRAGEQVDNNKERIRLEIR